MDLRGWNNQRETLEAQAGQMERQMLDVLYESRKNLIARLGASPSTFKQAYLQTLLAIVKSQMVTLQDQLSKSFETNIEIAQNSGDELFDALTPTQTPLQMVGINSEMVRSLADYRADLIKGVSSDLTTAITLTIRRNLIGGGSLAEFEKEMGSIGLEKGKFGSVAARIKTIGRTEYGRVLEMTNHAVLEKAVDYVPGLMKKWKTTTGHHTPPRPAHSAANNQIRAINKPFEVMGEALMFPKDPAGSAKNTCNCRCYCAPYVPAPEKK